MNDKEQKEFDQLVAERDGAKFIVDELKERLAAKTPAEAGFSVNLTLGAGDIITGGQITARTDFVTDAAKVMEKVDALVKARGLHWAEPLAKAPPPTQTKAQESVKDGTPEARAAVAQAEAVPAGPWETVDVAEIHIEPKADGLVSVEFWNPGRKYAEEYVKWKPENVKGLLKHVMTIPVNDDGSIKACKVACACRVYYSLGKEKTGPNAKPGSRWHDVAHVRLIE